MAPFGIALGTVVSAASVGSAVTGKDWLTGRELSGGERVVEGIFGGIGLVGGTFTIAKTAVTGGFVDDALRLLKPSPTAANSAAKATVESSKKPMKMDLQFFSDKGSKAATSGAKKASGAKGTLDTSSKSFESLTVDEKK